MCGKVIPRFEDLLAETPEGKESVLSLDDQQRSKHGLLQSMANLAHPGKPLSSSPSTPALIRLQLTKPS